MQFLGIGSQPVLEITLNGIEKRKHVPLKDKNNQTFKAPLYTGDDDISGQVDVKLNKAKKLEHTGIRIELIGHIEMVYDSKQSSDFMTMARELEPAGTLTQDKTFQFAFNKFEKQYESYYGISVRLRYFLRVTINRNYAPKIVKEVDFAVYNYTNETEIVTPGKDQSFIKMEVGIEDCLHIEFEYNKAQYHLKDCVVGKVSFMLVRIKLKTMELDIVKRETTGSGKIIFIIYYIFNKGPNSQTESETIAKYEVMDGCPTKGEIIPIRLYLSGYDLTPSYKAVSGKFSVKYFLNLVLIDDEDRRYFKQQEIILWRKKPHQVDK